MILIEKAELFSSAFLYPYFLAAIGLFGRPFAGSGYYFSAGGFSAS